MGDRLYRPNQKLAQVVQLSDTVSCSHSRHDFRFGGQILYTYAFEDSAIDDRGSIAFDGQFTSQAAGILSGSPVADLLLGQTSSATLGTRQVAHVRNRYFGVFVNDSWKLTRRLTINLGLRYDLQTPWRERDNLINNFEYDPSSPTFGTLVNATCCSIRRRSGANLDTNNLAPRVGLAYRLTPRTVVQAAFGVLYGALGYAPDAVAPINPPYLVNVTVSSPTTVAVSSIVLAIGSPPGLLSPTNAPNPTLYSISPNYPMPLVNQWNFSIQHQLTAKTSATVSYVGSSAYDLQNENDINNPIPGPGALNPRRSFPNFAGIYYESPYEHATFEDLQRSLEKRYSRGVVATAAYTYSHSIDGIINFEDEVGGGVPQNPLDTSGEKASSGYDVRHRFVTSVVYDLPIGRKGSFLGGSEVTRAILGGWQAGGIFVGQTGYPLTPSVSPKPSNTETPAYPNRICDGNLSGCQRTVSRLFDAPCFAPASPFTYGNSGRSVIRAPGLVNLDSMVNRTFHFTESRYVAFRTEFFNLPNSVHFARPNLTVGNANFGSITSTATASASPARQIELALKVWF